MKCDKHNKKYIIIQYCSECVKEETIDDDKFVSAQELYFIENNAIDKFKTLLFYGEESVER